MMEIREARDTDADAVAELQRLADDARVVSAEGWAHGCATTPERARLLRLAAELDGQVVAVGAAGLNTFTSAEGAAWASVTVAPEHRRNGIGSDMLEQLLDHLRTIDAKRATSFFRQTDEAERWADARGWTRILTGPLIAVDPRTIPEPAPPPGFRCVAFAELEPRAVYKAVTEAALDEPSPDLHDDIRLDDFLREWEDPDLDLDSSTAVLEGDHVVAFTFLHVVGDRGQHGFTGTLRDYRGRGLATTAKRYALRNAASRGVTRVTTSNAEQNAAMRAVNRGLGFELVGEHIMVARDL